jgi:phage terminase large subunit-like protein
MPEALAGLSKADLEALLHHWCLYARDDQLPPEGDDWTIWLLLGGRGSGKTRAGAEWVRGLALGLAGFAAAPVGRIALVGETYADVREVMVEGVSGLMRVHPTAERPLHTPSRRRIEWPNGAVAQCFSAEDPEALRGPQFDAAWCDELAKWPDAEATFDMLQFGLRLGARPRQLITTTPRPIPLLKRLIADPRCVTRRATTAANRFNLAPRFLDAILDRYKGTALGRQEIDGEIVEDRPDALFPRAMIDAAREDGAPDLLRVVVAVDPPAGGRRGGVCGIVAAGRDAAGVVHVLEDASIEAAKPERWAGEAIAAYRRWEADALICEVNQGGDMVAAVIAAIDPTVPVSPVRATRGKRLRAEPVAALYAKGRVRHAGPFGPLADQLAAFGPDGTADGASPDRVDALVWAVTALALTGREAAPRVRQV